MKQEEFDVAFDAFFKDEKEIFEHNKKIIDGFDSHAMKEFSKLVEGCRIRGKIEFVDEPLGDQQDEDYIFFKDVHVDQSSFGDSGDSFMGTIYAKVGDKWIAIPYDC